MQNPIDYILGKYLRGLAFILEKADDKYQVYDKLIKLDENSTKFKEEHPIISAGAQVAKGTATGLVGNFISKK